MEPLLDRSAAMTLVNLSTTDVHDLVKDRCLIASAVAQTLNEHRKVTGR